jgi:transposase
LSKRYPSDLSDEAWALIEPWVRDGARSGPKLVHDRRRIVEAIFYVDSEGRRWRALPCDFPPWQTVYWYFARWTEDETLDRLHDALRDQVRMAQGRKPSPTAAIIDSQSVKGAEMIGAESRGYDGGKKINGRKRHIAVDTLGLLLVVVVTVASIQDRDGGHRVLACLAGTFSGIRLAWADAGYAGRLLTWAKDVVKLTVEVIKRTDDLAGFVVLPRRWVVERTFSWLLNHRRLARDYERETATSEALIKWAMVSIMARRLARSQAAATATTA